LVTEQAMTRQWVEDEEGYGVYERTDKNTPMRDVMLAGIYEPIGAVPELSTLLAPLAATAELNGLVVVRTEYRQPAIAALESIKFTLSSAASADPIEGDATYVLGGFGGSGWVTSMIGAGLVVMVLMQSVQTGVVHLAATKNPGIVAQLCAIGKGWSVLGGSDAVVAEASKIAQTPAVPTCPAGTTWSSMQNACVAPINGGEKPAPAEDKKLAAWVLPVAIGGGALLIAGLLVIGQKGPKPAATMRANNTRGKRRKS
jgi:hypothetical protein